MSDDLAADAATWVPPWQRPAAGPDAGPRAPVDDDISRDDASGDDLGNEVDEAGESTAAPDEDAARLVESVAEPEEGAADAGLPRQWAGLAGVHWEDTPDVEAAESDSGVAEPGEQAVADVWPEADEADARDVPDEAGAGEADAGDMAPAVAMGRASVRPRSRAGEPDVAEPVRAAASIEAPEAGGEVAAVPVQRASDVDDLPPRVLDESELMPALEAILMVVDEPVSELTLAGVLDVPAEQVANALIDLSAAYTREGRGFDLRRAAGGWRFYTRADYSSFVEKFVLDGQQMRLTQASLETLAVIAYKQPVSRSRVSAIRGVNCDGVIRTLITRGMIEECGTDPDSGAHLYRTTNLFLEKLGLDSVEQLPPLAPFLPDNLDEVAAGG